MKQLITIAITTTFIFSCSGNARQDKLSNTPTDIQENYQFTTIEKKVWQALLNCLHSWQHISK